MNDDVEKTFSYATQNGAVMVKKPEKIEDKKPVVPFISSTKELMGSKS